MTTLKNLALALVNATLLLVALCLFLALMVANSAERAADRFSDAVSSLAPVRTGISEISDNIQGLRADVRVLIDRPGIVSDAQADALNDQIAALTAQLGTVDAQLADLREIPDQVISTAIDHVADRMSDGVMAYRNCSADDVTGET